MKDLPSCIARILAASSVAAALVLGSHSAHTQVTDTTTTEDLSTSTHDVAKPARPKVKYDGTFDVEGINYGIPYYFQEGKIYEEEYAHVYYAPAFHLTVDDDLSIKHHIDEDNESLTLYFQRGATSKDIVTALRNKLISAAKDDDKYDSTMEGTNKYRIDPLLPDYIVFRSTKAYKRKDGGIQEKLSSDQVRGVATQSGPFSVTFYNLAKNQAEKFVAELQTNIVQIEFQYIFAGVSDETCIAQSKDRLDQSIDLFKKVVGKGREGYVSRNQVVSIADQIVKGNYFSVRCADFATAADLMRDLMAILDKAKTIEIADWGKMDDLIAFDVDSFKADVTNSLSEISNETARSTLESAIAEVSARSESKHFGFGREIKSAGNFLDIITGSIAEALNVQYGSAESEAKSKAARMYANFFIEKGISIDWNGTKFVPKSVDVHTASDLQAKWGKGIEIKYSITKDAERQEWMRLTMMDRSELISRQELDDFRNEIEQSVFDEIDKIDRFVLDEIDKIDRFVKKRTDRLDRSVKERIGRLEHSVLVRSYRFNVKKDHGHSDYLTGISTTEYPLAFIAGWKVSCNDHTVQPPYLRGYKKSKRWLIVFNEDSTACNKLYVHVIYMSRSLGDANAYYVHNDSRSSGGHLEGGVRED